MQASISRPCGCVLAALLAGTPMLAQESAARLRVVDTDGLPIPFAVVTIDKAGAQIADDSGRLVVPRRNDDSLRFRVRRIGYAEFNAMLPSSANGRYVITLTPLPTQLASVTVSERAHTPLAMRGFYDRVERVQNGAIVGSFFTPEELDEMNEYTLSGMLRRNIHVHIGRTSPRRGMPATVATGRGDCRMNILIDGMLATGRGDYPDIDQLIDGRSIMAIEVYPSGANAPAELISINGTGSCGIVAIWTGGRY